MRKNRFLRKTIIVCGVVIVLINILSMSAYAFDSRLSAEFDTPDWNGSVIQQGHYNYKHQFVPDDDDEKSYAYEYKRGLGQLALKYGNTDMYRDKESKPDNPREKFDTAYYYKHEFEIREAILSSAKLSFIQVGGNDYAVSDEMTYVTYVHVENGVVHRFQFWNCTKKEIESVLSSATYPSTRVISYAENENKREDKKEKENNITMFFIIGAIVAIIIIALMMEIRKLGKQKEKPDRQEDSTSVIDKSEKNEDAIDRNNNIKSCSVDSTVTWEESARKKQEILGESLVEDPIYGNTEWEKDYETGDVYRYSGYKSLDWYCPKNGVTVDEAIECIVGYRKYCEKRQYPYTKFDYDLSTLFYIRVDHEQKLSDEQIALCQENNINIIVDMGEYVYYSLTQKLLYEDERYYGYGSVDDATTIYERNQSVISKPYVLGDFREFEDISSASELSDKKLYHDESMAKWRLTVRLYEERYWFLSVVFSENGEVEKYSLDYEGANDSHYVFTDEAGVRKLLYTYGDERKYLDEIFSRYIAENSGFALIEKISPFIKNRFYF